MPQEQRVLNATPGQTIVAYRVCDEVMIGQDKME